jgi:hypothetical protein
MGNILNDIVDEVNIKPNKTKLVLKWVISIAGSLIVLAFAFGQFKSSFFNRMDSLEAKVDNQTIVVEQLKTDMNAGFKAVDAKVDKVYTDGLTIFNNFQEYNDAQLGLIIDYGNGNKDMLKRMLEISSMKQTQQVESQIATAKAQDVAPTYKGEVEFVPVEEGRNLSIVATPLKNKPFMNELFFIETSTNDTTFNIVGATREYVNSINKEKYEVGAVMESNKYPNRYDFSYRKKRQ